MTSGPSLIRGGKVLIDGAFEYADLVVVDGVIADITASEVAASATTTWETTLDVDGRLVTPGLIDLQCNGAVGHDFTSDPSSIEHVGTALPQWGVTSFCPTIITASVATRQDALDVMRCIRSAPAASVTAEALGLHFEGPIVSPDQLGTHDPGHAGLVSREEIDAWCASAHVSIVTLAPEVSGAMAIVEQLVASGICVAAGHTDATAATLRSAFDLGLSAVTHLFNAMPQLHHREPSVIGATLADDTVVASLICDGVHVDESLVKVVQHCLGERLLLVTDAAAAMGAPDGDYTIGSTSITSRSGRVTNDNGALAGSALTLDQAIRNLVSFSNCSSAAAIAAATSTPARLLGLTDRGSIAIGRRADLVVFDQQLRPNITLIKGHVAWKS